MRRFITNNILYDFIEYIYAISKKFNDGKALNVVDMEQIKQSNLQLIPHDVIHVRSLIEW